MGPVVEKSVLAEAEKAHFAIGSERHASWLDSIEPIVRMMTRNGFRKPKDISRLLNKQFVKTAIGQPWTPRLAWFLLGFLYSDERKKRRIPRPSFRPTQTRITNATLLPKRDLTKEEMANRLRALQAYYQDRR